MNRYIHGRAIWICLCLSLLVAASCRHGQGGKDDAAAPSSKKSTAANREQVSVPPGLDATLVTRHAPGPMARAKMPLEDIVATLPRPSYLPPADPVPVAPVDPVVRDIPVEAQRAYVAGRQALHDHHEYEAIQHLIAADRLSPNQPQILRLLGQAYFRSGVRVRGAFYLAQVVSLEPDDMASFFYLGRHAIEQGDWGQAIATFAHALGRRDRAPSVDAGLWPLMHFFLASALEHDRYDLASLQQFEAFLTEPLSPETNTRFAGELRVLQRQAATTWMTVGDAYCRLGEPQAALDAYRRSQTSGDANDLDLLRRLLYVQLLLHQDEDAIQSVMAALGDEARPQILELVKYLDENSVSASHFAARLRRIYEASHHPAYLALAIAQLLPPDQADELLLAHLGREPDNQAVYDRIIQLQLNTHAGVPANVLRAALTTQAAQNRVALRLSSAYLARFFELTGDADLVVAAIESGDAAQQGQLRLIKAAALRRLDRTAEARASYEALLAESPDLHPARLELVELLVQQGEFAQALAVLEPVKDSEEPAFLLLRVRVLCELGRIDEALAMIDRVIAAQPTNAELPLEKAELLLRSHDLAGAERTLVSALNERPDAEPIYLKLREIYETKQLPEWETRQAWLNEKALRNIPLSRMARFVQVERHLAQRELDAAIAILRSLLAEQSDDETSFRTLIGCYLATQRTAEGNKLIEDQLKRYPDERKWIELAVAYYSETRQYEPLAERLAQLLARKQADNPVLMARQYLVAMREIDRAEQADPFVQKLTGLYPEHAADLNYYRSSLYMQSDPPRAEAILEQVLKDNRRHAPANNDLGYSWADRGINLDQALAMIQIAVEAEPNNGNYRDSLGWVYYKLGRFGEAVEELSRAAADPAGGSPVISEHLGDALHRAGRADEAVQAWRRTLTEIGELQQFDRSFAQDPDIQACDERVRRKLTDIAARRAPTTAHVPGVDDQAAPPAGE